MGSENFLAQAFVYLTAAIVSVPIAKRLGLGSVLGYLLAGAAIGPFALRFVDGDGGGVMHYAEFGVVMMLFLIGLELRPARLWQLRGPVLGLGGAQVVGTAVAAAPIAMALGLPWRGSVALGLILAMSSTAIVLQSLGERKLLNTPGGEACFSVLLFQDLAVIPILAVLPLLSMTRHPAAQPAGGEVANWVDTLPGWAHALVVLAAVAAVIAAGRYALAPFFRYIARTDLREVFTATALGLVVGIALLMQAVGLSAALGTFLAGVVLADSEYRRQLEADVEPFKGLLLGLFFISVGASIDFGYFARQPATIFGLVLGLLALKFVVLLILSRVFGMAPIDGSLFAFALAQGGEFIFVLLAFAVSQDVLTPAVANPLVAAVALSMAATPLLLVGYEKMVRPRLIPPATVNDRPPDEIHEHDSDVILAGFGRFGHVVGRLLRANGFGTAVLENDADWVDALREFGMKTYYGDATRLDLLHSAGAAHARLFVIAIDDQAQSLQLVETVQKEFPHLIIFARAIDRTHAYELMRRGLPLEHVFRETMGSSMEMGIGALQALGFDETHATRAAQLFRRHDDDGMVALLPLFDGDRKAYTSAARQHLQNFENLLRADLRRD